MTVTNHYKYSNFDSKKIILFFILRFMELTNNGNIYVIFIHYEYSLCSCMSSPYKTFKNWFTSP